MAAAARSGGGRVAGGGGGSGLLQAAAATTTTGQVELTVLVTVWAGRRRLQGNLLVLAQEVDFGGGKAKLGVRDGWGNGGAHVVLFWTVGVTEKELPDWGEGMVHISRRRGRRLG